MVSLPSSQPPTKLGKSFMQPRIYVYKVTFEEIPDWYWGAHKESEFDDGYLGSPTTHAWKWEFYTPYLQICEIFPYTDEGWKEACSTENRCIKPDLNNPLCLNEHYGSFMSLEVCRQAGRKGGKVSDSSFAGRASCASMKETETGFFDPKWAPLRKKWTSLAGQARAQQMETEGYPGLGQSFEAASAAGKKAASQRWEDPEHPELGFQSAATLVGMQKRRGYAHGRKNRRRV